MKLTIAGFKAHNHVLRLDPLMVLSASNGAGKSAVAEAIRFLALGYVPGHGKRPQDTAALLRGSAMQVTLELPDGRTISRRLEETPKGFRTQARCSWIEGDRSTVHAREILALFGRDEEDVAESLDVRQLLAASPLHREARIAALLASSGGGAAETVEEAIGLARAKGASTAELDSLREELAERISGEGLESALDWTNGEKRRLTAELQGKLRLEQEVEDRLRDLPRVGAGELRDLEREAARLEAAAAETERHAARVDAATAEADEAEHQAAFAREARREFEAGTTDRGALKKELADIDRTLDALVVPPQEDPEECSSLLRRAHEAEVEAAAIGEVTVPEDLEPGSAGPEPGPGWAEVRDIAARLIARAGQETSPFGYEVLTVAQRLEQLSRAALRSDEVARAEKGRRLERERQLRLRRIEEARTRRARRDELLSRAARLRAEAQDLLRASRTSFLAAHGAALRKRQDLAARRASARQLLARTESADRSTLLAVERATVELEVRRRHLEELRASAPPPPDAGRLAALREEIDRRTRARAVREELERAMSERARLEESRATHAALEWSLQRIRERRLDEGGGPLVRTMTRILRAGGRRETPFLEASRGSCRIGWRTPAGQPVLIQSLSGGEWTLFASALAAALLMLRNPPLRFLFVEAGEADQETLRSLLAGLRSVSASLSMVMILTHLPVSPKDWTVVGRLPTFKAESA